MAARIHFDEQLKQLNREVLKMGSLIEKALKGATLALETDDRRRAQKVIDADEQINRKERDIESLCLKLLLQQQPVARDLRTISAALKMITDMERIGDQAADICEIMLSTSTGQKLLGPEVEHLPKLAQATITMVNGAIDAFVERNVEFAHEVMQEDNAVDQLFNTVRDELIKLLRQDDSANERTVDLLMIAKYFERIGDHAQNIAEWVEYSLTGIHKGRLLG